MELSEQRQRDCNRGRARQIEKNELKPKTVRARRGCERCSEQNDMTFSITYLHHKYRIEVYFHIYVDSVSIFLAKRFVSVQCVLSSLHICLSISLIMRSTFISSAYRNMKSVGWRKIEYDLVRTQFAVCTHFVSRELNFHYKVSVRRRRRSFPSHSSHFISCEANFVPYIYCSTTSMN